MKYYLIFLLFPLTAIGQTSKDKFSGNVVVQWIDDGRSMMLLKEFSYIDPSGKEWKVPKKIVVDGASIPQIFWTIIGGPYEGEYRKASVVHDYYCVQKTESWRDVHLMFYHACLTAGTSISKAKTMYAAVYAGGPRWEIHTQRNLNGNLTKFVMEKEVTTSPEKLNAVMEWIKNNNPTVEEITSKLDQVVEEGYKVQVVN